MRHRAVRRWCLMTVCVTGFVLAQCGQKAGPGTTDSANGTITGVASPCDPFAITSSSQYRQLPVTVYLTRGSRTEAEQIVKGTHTYRFSVPAGDYVVATHEGGGSKPLAITVHAGRTVHANIPSYCL